MGRTKLIIKKRIFVFLFNIIILFVMVLNFLNNNLLPVILEYGQYQCSNISTRIVNLAVEEIINPMIKEDIVVFNENDTTSIEFNASILNSIATSVVKKIQTYFYKLEKGILDDATIKKIGLDLENDKLKKGIIYEMPISRAFDNPLISNFGMSVPIRYEIIGGINSQIVSVVKEYGINNALLEVNLEINIKSKTTIPILSNEEINYVSIPLVMKVLQGEIPDSFFGTNVLKGV